MALAFRHPTSGQIVVGSAKSASKTIAASDPGGGGQSAIDHAATLTQRNALAALHTIDTGDAGFTGFSDTSGWTTVTVTSATELATALNAVAASDTKVIECQWNGSSSASSYAINGLTTGSLTSNGSSPWGYNRPTASVVVKPASGYSPIIGTTSGASSLGFNGTPLAFEFTGFSKVEWRNMEFAANLEFTQNGSRPTPVVCAFNNCTIRTLIVAWAPHTMHFEDCYIGQDSGTGQTCGIRAPARFLRVWNCKFHRMIRSNDTIAFFGHDWTPDWQAGLDTHAWIAGNTMWNFDGVTDLASLNHLDVFQYSTGSDTNGEYNIIFEFNIFAANGYATQGLWGDDWSTSTSIETNSVVHNNILMIGAYWGISLFDENASGDLYAYRNLIYRGTVLDSAGAEDPDMRIYASNLFGGSPTTDAGGTIDIRENFATQILTGDASVTVTQADNVVLDTRKTASAGTKMSDLLTGNGTWTTDGHSRQTYTAPDAGETDYATARAALIAFSEPIAGWNDGAGCGPIDPAEWPTTFGGALS